MSTLTAPLATSLVDQVKHILATAGYDAAVRHRRTHALMRGGFITRQMEDRLVLVYHTTFPPTAPMEEQAREELRMMPLYADALTGKGVIFTRATSPKGIPYLIVKRLV